MQGRPSELRKLQHAQTDGTCADDEHMIVSLWLAAIDCMAADSERLHQRQLLIRKIIGGMQLLRWQNDLRSQSAITMDTENLQGFTAIRASALTGRTGAAVQIRLHGAAIANADMGYFIRYGEDFHAEFMSENTRVLDEGHLP